MKEDQIYEIASKLADEAFGDKGVYYYSQRQELTYKFNEMLLAELKSLNIEITE